jgi:Flp pilus assembly protein TadD
MLARMTTAALCCLVVAPLASCGHTSSTLNLPPPRFDSARQMAGDSSPSLRFARAARDAGDLAAAIRLYRTLVTEPSASSAVKAEYGQVLLNANMLDDAIEMFSQVPAGASERLDALLGLTKAYLALDEPARAIVSADQALALAPHDVRVLVDRGAALDSLGRHAEAQDSYRAALVTAPRNVSARNNLALSLAVTGRYEEAVELLTPLARSSATTPRIRENLALVYGLMGDSERAAVLSSADLDASSIKANQAFFATVRGVGSDRNGPPADPPGVSIPPGAPPGTQNPH